MLTEYEFEALSSDQDRPMLQTLQQTADACDEEQKIWLKCYLS